MKEGNALVDSLLAGPSIVYGSLPPDNRDLDLLVRPEDRRASLERLEEGGFVGRGTRWAIFGSCSAFGVDVLSVAEWTSTHVAQDLFTRSLPIEGFARLRRPAPHHALLIIAGLLVRGAGGLSEKRRRRLEAALQEDPMAWQSARREARRWRLQEGLVLLQRKFEGDGALRAQMLRADAEATDTSVLHSARLRLAERGRGTVIALSGLDGSGKSTQAEALQGALSALGFEAVIWWSKLGVHDVLDLIAAFPKRVLRAITEPSAPNSPPPGDRPVMEIADPAQAVRQRSPILTHSWATIVALVNAFHRRRALRRASRGGRIIICDRYTLDSLAHIKFRYGVSRGFALQVWLIRLITPKPRRAYFLDVDPRIALARKNETYTQEEMATLASLYRSNASFAGVERLDGEAPVEDLCRHIGSDVWLSLI